MSMSRGTPLQQQQQQQMQQQMQMQQMQRPLHMSTSSLSRSGGSQGGLMMPPMGLAPPVPMTQAPRSPTSMAPVAPQSSPDMSGYYQPQPQQQQQQQQTQAQSQSQSQQTFSQWGSMSAGSPLMAPRQQQQQPLTSGPDFGGMGLGIPPQQQLQGQGQGMSPFPQLSPGMMMGGAPMGTMGSVGSMGSLPQMPLQPGMQAGMPGVQPAMQTGMTRQISGVGSLPVFQRPVVMAPGATPVLRPAGYQIPMQGMQPMQPIQGMQGMQMQGMQMQGMQQMPMQQMPMQQMPMQGMQMPMQGMQQMPMQGMQMQGMQGMPQQRMAVPRSAITINPQTGQHVINPAMLSQQQQQQLSMRMVVPTQQVMGGQPGMVRPVVVTRFANQPRLMVPMPALGGTAGRGVMQPAMQGQRALQMSMTQYRQMFNQFGNQMRFQKCYVVRTPDGQTRYVPVQQQAHYVFSQAPGSPGVMKMAPFNPMSPLQGASPKSPGAQAVAGGAAALPVGEDEWVKAPKSRDNLKDIKEWDKAWKKVLKAQPPASENTAIPLSLLLNHIKGIMAFDIHPLNAGFNKAIDDCVLKVASVQEIGTEDAKQQLQNLIVACIQVLVPMLYKKYDELEARAQWTEDCMFEFLFQRLHTTVFKKYNARFKEDDDAHLAKFRQFSHITPAHLKVNKKFWLTEEKTIDIHTPVDKMPYGDAIATLKQLPNLDSPGAMVQCLVDTGKAIYQSVIKFWGDRLPPDKLEITADEFLPLFGYVTIKSQLAVTISACKYIEDFQTEAESSGEKGYSLVTFQTCLAFLLALDETQLEDTDAPAAAASPSASTANPLIASLVPEDASSASATQLVQESSSSCVTPPLGQQPFVDIPPPPVQDLPETSTPPAADPPAFVPVHSQAPVAPVTHSVPPPVQAPPGTLHMSGSAAPAPDGWVKAKVGPKRT